MATDELTARDVQHPAEQYEEVLRSPGVRLVDAHGHEVPLSAEAAAFFSHGLAADRRRAADHAARLMRDQPDHPRVQAARERVRARRADSQA